MSPTSGPVMVPVPYSEGLTLHTSVTWSNNRKCKSESGEFSASGKPPRVWVPGFLLDVGAQLALAVGAALSTEDVEQHPEATALPPIVTKRVQRSPNVPWKQRHPPGPTENPAHFS